MSFQIDQFREKIKYAEIHANSNGTNYIQKLTSS